MERVALDDDLHRCAEIRELIVADDTGCEFGGRRWCRRQARIDFRFAAKRDFDLRNRRVRRITQGQGASRGVAAQYAIDRSEERRVGKECVSKCSSRWSP